MIEPTNIVRRNPTKTVTPPRAIQSGRKINEAMSVDISTAMIPAGIMAPIEKLFLSMTGIVAPAMTSQGIKSTHALLFSDKLSSLERSDKVAIKAQANPAKRVDPMKVGKLPKTV